MFNYTPMITRIQTLAEPRSDIHVTYPLPEVQQNLRLVGPVLPGFPFVTPICPYSFDRRKVLEQLFEDGMCTLAVEHTCRVNHQSQQQTHDIHSNMPLAAFDLLVAIVALLVSRSHGFYRLGIQDSRSGFGLSSGTLPNLVTQTVVQSIEGAILIPSVEVLY